MAALPQDVVADLQQENARLLAELRAAQDRETATAEAAVVVAADRALGQRQRAVLAENPAAVTAGLVAADGALVQRQGSILDGDAAVDITINPR